MSRTLRTDEKFARVRSAPLATAALVGFLAAYLTAMWILRGDRVAGWELLGAAHAKVLLAEQGNFGALRELWLNSRNFQYWTPISSVLYGFVPGWLSHAFPWLYWAQVFNLVVAIGAFLLAGRLPIHAGILWAAIAASPTLLIHFIVGYPYISGALPYILALLLMFGTRLRPAGAGLVWEALGWLAVLELSFHCYEVGKTVFVVPVIGSLTLRDVSPRRRLLWMAAGGALASATVAVGGAIIGQGTSELGDKLARLPNAAGLVGRQLFVDWYIDGPALAGLGVVCSLFVRRDAAFWRLGFLAQLGFMLLGSLQFADFTFMRPRRALLFLTWSAFLVAWAWRDLSASRGKRTIVLALLVMGQAITVYTGWRFYLDRPPRLSLPYTHSQADFVLDTPLLEDIRTIQTLIDSGDEEHFFFYGYTAFPENTTDPEAIPERLYLQLPDSEFRSRVHFVDERHCRYSCVPSVREAEARPLLRKASSPFYVHSYRVDYGRNPRGRFLGNSSFIPMAKLEGETFETLRVEKYRASRFVRIESEDEARAADLATERGVCLWETRASPAQMLIHGGPDRIKQGPPTVLQLPLALRPERPTAYYLEAIVDNIGETMTVFEATFDDEFVLLINDQAILDLQHMRPQARRTVRVLLPGGRNFVQGYLVNRLGAGVLELEARGIGGEPLAWFCDPRQ
jgi:hypothetical protein